MILKCDQSGYALLLMLLVMIGGSTMWINVAMQSMSPTSGNPYYLHTDHRALIQARQSLLSYASLYPFLYGPSGSGPGHLPCPDTDDQSALEQTNPFAGDSPNPPCGSSRSSSGRLPRHVTLPGIRYSFHSQPYQRFDYSVYEHVVNNPINRIVNPSLLSTANGMSTIAATIESSAIASGSVLDRLPLLSITNSALLDVVKPAVAAWIVDVVERSGIGACRLLMRNTVTQDTQVISNAIQDSRSPLMRRCQRLTQLQEACTSIDDADEVIHNDNDTDHVLLLLVDQLPQGEFCISDEPGGTTIDRIATNRHWFFRNRWAEWINIQSSPDCTAGHVECSLEFQMENSAHRRLSIAQKLVFQWQPIP